MNDISVFKDRRKKTTTPSASPAPRSRSVRMLMLIHNHRWHDDTRRPRGSHAADHHSAVSMRLKSRQDVRGVRLVDDDGFKVVVNTETRDCGMDDACIRGISGWAFSRKWISVGGDVLWIRTIFVYSSVVVPRADGLLGVEMKDSPSWCFPTQGHISRRVDAPLVDRDAHFSPSSSVRLSACFRRLIGTCADGAVRRSEMS
jgi:hypothetical protein